MLIAGSCHSLLFPPYSKTPKLPGLYFCQYRIPLNISGRIFWPDFTSKAITCPCFSRIKSTSFPALSRPNNAHGSKLTSSGNRIVFNLSVNGFHGSIPFLQEIANLESPGNREQPFNLNGAGTWSYLIDKRHTLGRPDGPGRMSRKVKGLVRILLFRVVCKFFCTWCLPIRGACQLKIVSYSRNFDKWNDCLLLSIKHSHFFLSAWLNQPASSGQWEFLPNNTSTTVFLFCVFAVYFQ